MGTDAKDEIGRLSRAFDQMTENLKTITASRDELNKEITTRKQAEAELQRIEWLLTKKPEKIAYMPPYGNLTELNRQRLILDSVGGDSLTNIVNDCIDLLGTSSAVYEKNGDYALGIFSSGWCRFLDQASRSLCGIHDNMEALKSGKWGCHEACWSRASRVSIETGQAIDIECFGGIRLYAVPIYAGKEIIGSINFGYGDPPKDSAKLEEIAQRCNCNVDELRKISESYDSRPSYIIALAKDRLLTSARLLGEIVERKQAEAKLMKYREHLEDMVKERTVELASVNEQLQIEINKHERAKEELQRNHDTHFVISSLLRLSLEDVPLEEILKQSLDLILSISWLSFQTRGGIFLIEDKPDVLVMKALRGLSEYIQKECGIVPFGKCFCGRAALTQKIEFSDSLDERHEVSYEGIVSHGHYCIPILLSGKTLGVINLYLKEGHKRDKREEEFLTAIANTLAGIIMRKRAEDSLLTALNESHLHKAQTLALLESTRAALRYREFNDAAKAIFAYCKNLIGAPAGYVALLSKDETQNEVLFLDLGKLSCTVDPSLPMPLRGLRKEAYLNGKAVYHNDFSNSGWMRFVPEGHVGVNNVLFVPLIVEGKSIGLFGFGNKPGGFTEEDARIASEFSEIAVIAFVNKRAEMERQFYQERLEAVKDIGAVAISSINLGEVLKLIIVGTIEATGATVGMIFLKDPHTGVLTWGASVGLSEAFVSEYKNRPIQPGEGLTGRIAQSGQPIYIPMNSSHDSRIARQVIKDEGLNSFIGVPLYAAGEIVGVMNILTRPPNVLSEEDISLVASIGAYVGSAIRNAQLFEEHKKARKLILQSKQDWENTFDNITDMVTIHDKDFNIIRANKAAEKILGLLFLEELEEDVKAKCFKFYHGKECPPEGCPSCPCLKTGKPVIFEMFEPHLNMFVEIRAMPRFDENNQIIGLIHVARDITERRKLEEQLRHVQRMEAIGQLAGGVAHDFNNFLTAIIGYGNLLQMEIKENEPLMIYVKQILAASEKAANLTQSLLAFSKKQISNPEPININEIIKDIEKLLSRVIGEDIELRIILNPPPPFDKGGRGGIGDLTIMADRIQIEQVLMNLCTNARDAMPQGGTLIIKTELVELGKEFRTIPGYGEPGLYALISVSDTGGGMDEKTREKIFEPFFTTKEVGKGTGLGLSIVYGIIKQHNGYINCYSEPGKGTTFKIYLPVSLFNLVAKETKAVETPELIAATETVLLAEDEEEVRELTRQILKGSGYKVLEAVDGEDAVNKFVENKDKIDILLFDVIMPKMNGKEAYDKIKKIRPDIKVLLTSGFPADFIHSHGIMEQGLNFVSKPVSPTELLKKIREVLNK